jgi:hypothetical protein
MENIKARLGAKSIPHSIVVAVYQGELVIDETGEVLIAA